MRPLSPSRHVRLLAATLLSLPAWAGAPAAQDFAWRARLELPTGVSAARLPLPADALRSLQSREAHDLRVFNAAGEAVAFALTGAAAGVPRTATLTPDYKAHPLHASRPRAGPPSLQVRIDDAANTRSVWLQLDAPGGRAGGAEPLPAAVFDTRAQTGLIGAIEVVADLPPNTPVSLRLTSSSDLAQWRDEPLRGRLYRFNGDDAPRNQTLELESPLAPAGRYLRLDWTGHDGVRVRALRGRIEGAATPLQRPRARLSAARADGTQALEWPLDFATPLAALALETARPNTLAPVRVLGRDDPAQPWRTLGQTVVYRLAGAADDSTNPPLPLAGAAPRWLRVEATHGQTLGALDLQATVEFEPLQLVFVASGPGPFELVAGRPATAAAALTAAMLSGALGSRLEDLPLARVVSSSGTPSPRAASPLAAWLPAGASERGAWLWAVLVGGVLLLAGVAWRLMRQLRAAPGLAQHDDGAPR